MVQAPDEILALRSRLNAGAWDDVVAAANMRQLLPALGTEANRKHLTAGIPEFRSSDGRVTITLALSEGIARHQAVRAAMLDRLIELVGLLNASGMEPLLLKGARTLWTGIPGWRTMGDLDLLTPGRAVEAQAVAVRAGYTPAAGYEQPANWHHEINLYRDDLPGWLEFHDRAAMHRADILLSTETLMAQSLRDSRHDGIARILPPHTDLLYCVIHHHVSHRGDKYGRLSTKGLYEFAAAFADLTDAGRHELLNLAVSHPRLVAILDLWLAAAAERFRMPVPAPFSIQPDAIASWKRMSHRTGDAIGNYGGILNELRMGLSGKRLSRMPDGATWLGRQKLRWSVMSSLLSPATRKTV
nr:nucleotidyltransferase family protein [Mesorhizobium sp.]